MSPLSAGSKAFLLAPTMRMQVTMGGYNLPVFVASGEGRPQPRRVAAWPHEHQMRAQGPAKTGLARHQG